MASESIKDTLMDMAIYSLITMILYEEASEDEYEDQLELYSSGKQLLTDKWDVIRNEGLGTTYFLQILITVLFFIAIYCAILALFVRKKETFIKTN